MKSKAPLAMIELVVMLLVFALAAAFCLQAFAAADGISRKTEARDAALLQAERAVELMKHTKGDLDAAAEMIGGVAGEASLLADLTEGMQLRITLVESELAQLGEALVEVIGADGERIITIPAAWQED